MEWVLGSATIVLVVVTTWYAWQTQQMVREMRRAREAQLTPSVELRVEHERWNPAVLALVVHNTGGGPARNVSFAFDKRVPYKLSSGGEPLALSDLKVFQRIPFLSAGQQLIIYFDVFANYWNNPDAPKEFSYTATYSDAFGHMHSISDVVDVGLMYQTAPVWDHPLKDIAKELKRVSDCLGTDLGDIAGALRKS